MTTAQISSEIFNSLRTQEARDWWNGMTNEGRNEFVCIAQDKGVVAAVEEVESCAAV